MDDEKSRGGPKGINWLAVRTYFLTHPNLTECAKKFGVSRQVISERASKEGWKEKAAVNLTNAQVKLDDVTSKDRAQALAQHAERADSLLDAGAKLEQQLLADEKMSVRSKIEAYKSLVEATDKVTRLGRDVRGITSGTPSATDSDNDQAGKTYEVVVEQETA